MPAWRRALPLAAVLLAGAAFGGTGVRVGPGDYRPLYPPSPGEESIPVAAFEFDRLPVTNAEYLEFVKAHPEWKRDAIASLFADAGYLSHWEAPDRLGDQALPTQPVTRVSWFAAGAYCESRGGRLPRIAEWELAAGASTTETDAGRDPGVRAQILSWYSKPTPEVLPEVGKNPANAWGLHDMHGLVWEWVDDFNSELVSSDNREDGGADRSRFCGAAALSAKDKEDYAAFMRVAFRSSLEGRSSTANLGFRCARDIEDSP